MAVETKEDKKAAADLTGAGRLLSFWAVPASDGENAPGHTAANWIDTVFFLCGQQSSPTGSAAAETEQQTKQLIKGAAAGITSAVKTEHCAVSSFLRRSKTSGGIPPKDRTIVALPKRENNGKT